MQNRQTGKGLLPFCALIWMLASCVTSQELFEEAQEQGGTKRTNIVLFLVDDLGWQDSSVSMSGNRSPFQNRYRTPNLEKLSKRGAVFSNAYASAPVCTPTRTAIMTGMAPARTHITYWTLHENKDTSRDRPEIAAPPWEVNGLQPGQYETLPEALAQVGYRTIHVGKAHFGAHNTGGANPLNLGFEVNVAGHASGAPGSFYGTHHFTSAGRQGKSPGSAPSPWDVPGLDAYHGKDVYLTDVLAEEACQAIKASVAEGAPFYMNFAPYAVHTPIMANPRFTSDYPDLDEKERAYASMIASYDAALGRLLETLEETGQLANTAIVFHSDNGGLSAHARGAAPDGQNKHTHNAPLRSGKGSAFEGGTRVPMVIAWPGVTDTEAARGTPIHASVVSHDLFPTIIAIAGLQADYGPSIDGRDLSPLLTGRPAMFDHERILLWNQPHQWGAKGPGIEPFTAIRSSDWKLIYYHADQRFEMYDLQRDLGETTNLAEELPDKRRALAKVMHREMQRLGGQYSLLRSTGEAIPPPTAIP